MTKILKLPIFDLQNCNALQKNPQKLSIRLDMKLEDFVMKKLEKNDFVIFDPKNHNFLAALAKFLKNL